MKSAITEEWALCLGATFQPPSSVFFRVWAPKARTVAVRILGRSETLLALEAADGGYWEGAATDITPGTEYRYVLDRGIERPDPASRFQACGVHGPSTIVAPHAFPWTDQAWQGIPLEDYLIYELHTGTFTQEGTFASIISRLPYLKQELGITAVELMPVAQFPGTRNWGYDGAFLYSPQNSYGGPEELKRLVNAAHASGLAVIMDVVYNHLGPEGNYLADFGPYFTDAYKTPWGSAINYDGPYSDAVRDYVIRNAVYWIHEYHMDALRLDAIHGIFDFSAKHILQDIGEAVHAEGRASGRKVHVIAESDLNDARIISPIAKGGYGLDAQWSDDFHHALHCLLTEEQEGYYEDFGRLIDLAQAYQHTFVYSGEFSPHRKRRHGNSPKHCAPSQFVVCAQNHDQIGNRAKGDRHSMMISFEALKVANAAVFLSPNIPMIFMGEEYGETAPFLYFIDHGDPDLIEAVRRGRQQEFAAFGWTDVPDPYDLSTFEQSRLRPQMDTDPRQQAHFRWVQSLISLRKSVPALGAASKRDMVSAFTTGRCLLLHRKAITGPEVLVVLGFNDKPGTVSIRKPQGQWVRHLDSQAAEFGGTGESMCPLHVILKARERVTLDIPAFPAWVFLREDT